MWVTCIVFIMEVQSDSVVRWYVSSNDHSQPYRKKDMKHTMNYTYDKQLVMESTSDFRLQERLYCTMIKQMFHTMNHTCDAYYEKNIRIIIELLCFVLLIKYMIQLMCGKMVWNIVWNNKTYICNALGKSYHEQYVCNNEKFIRRRLAYESVLWIVLSYFCTGSHRDAAKTCNITFHRSQQTSYQTKNKSMKWQLNKFYVCILLLKERNFSSSYIDL